MSAITQLTPSEIRTIHLSAFDDCDWSVMRLCRTALGVDHRGVECITQAAKQAANERLAAMQAKGEI